MPFIIPAMGSHGGATVEGQLSVLASYGITEESMGIPIPFHHGDDGDWASCKWITCTF